MTPLPPPSACVYAMCADKCQLWTVVILTVVLVIMVILVIYV
jgi:hypothetical protein